MSDKLKNQQPDNGGSRCLDTMVSKYWYHTTGYVCVLCGHENVYRTRRPMPKPVDYLDRNEYHEIACEHHFV